MKTWLGGLGMVAAMGLVLAMAGTARAEIKIGVVDIGEVADNYQWSKDAREDLKTEMDALKTESERKIAKLSDLKLKRDGFDKASKEWKDLDDQLLNEEAKVRTWQMLEQYKIDRRNRDVLLDMYRQITLVVERLAKEKKLDLVFSKAFLAPTDITVDDSQSLEDLKRRIQSQRVIYPGPGVDLTKEATDILNKEYKAGKRPAKATTPAPGGTPRG
jgi:Skp family chaperone for outer membrane proteins